MSQSALRFTGRYLSIFICTRYLFKLLSFPLHLLSLILGEFFHDSYPHVRQIKQFKQSKIKVRSKN